MKKNRIIALLTVIVFGTCIVGCGNEVAPDSNSTNEVEANIEETNSDVPIVTPDVIFGDSFQDYVGERITVVGYPGFYTKFDDSTKDSLKEMGDGYLFITTKSELDWTAPQVFCIFDGDQTDVFTDEILDSFRENGTLIGITGICKERALLADCNPEFKQFDKTEVPFYQTDEVNKPEDNSTPETARELIELDITDVYDQDISDLLDYQFQINDKEEQPYVTFYCSSNGYIVGTYTCKLPAANSKKEFKQSWKLELYNGTTRYCTGHTSFLTGNEAKSFGKPFGKYIMEDTVILAVSRIVYTGYDNILE